MSLQWCIQCVFSLRLGLKVEFTISIEMQVAYLEIENNFILSASAQLDKGTEEVS